MSVMSDDMRGPIQTITLLTKQSTLEMAEKCSKDPSKKQVGDDRNIFLSCTEDAEGEVSSSDDSSHHQKSRRTVKGSNKKKTSVCKDNEYGEDCLLDYQAIRAKEKCSVLHRDMDDIDESASNHSDGREEDANIARQFESDLREQSDQEDEETLPIPRMLEFEENQKSVMEESTGDFMLDSDRQYKELNETTDLPRKNGDKEVSTVPHLLCVYETTSSSTDTKHDGMNENRASSTEKTVKTQRHKLSTEAKASRALLNISNEKNKYLNKAKQDKIDEAKKRTLLYSRKMLLIGADGMYGLENSKRSSRTKSTSRASPSSPTKRSKGVQKKPAVNEIKKLIIDPDSKAKVEGTQSTTPRKRRPLDLKVKREINEMLNEERKRRLHRKVLRPETTVVQSKPNSASSQRPAQRTVRRRSDFNLKVKQEINTSLREERSRRLRERSQSESSMESGYRASQYKRRPSTSSVSISSPSRNSKGGKLQVHDRLYSLSKSQQQRGRERRVAIEDTKLKKRNARQEHQYKPKISATRGAEMYYRGMERLQTKREELLNRKKQALSQHRD